jgi:SAM-dependent methyltransferase
MRDARPAPYFPLVGELFEIASVVDFGCGNGEWLRVWKSLGVSDVVGIDGDFIDRQKLLIGTEEFRAHDLREPLRLDRKFDLVQSLEVAEHLPDDCAESFVDTLVSHGERILFSAAVKGQMGIQHVNEQQYEYWRDKFATRGFLLVDWIRPKIQNQSEIAFWYRYNTLLFVTQTEFRKLSSDAQTYSVSAEDRVPDYSPASYRVRRSITKWLPVHLVDQIVRLAHRLQS